MTELELYKFINDNDIEWHWQENDGADDVLVFPHFSQIEEFAKFVKGISENGFPCTMMNGYFAFWMNDICNYYGIDMEKVFAK